MITIPTLPNGRTSAWPLAALLVALAGAAHAAQTVRTPGDLTVSGAGLDGLLDIAGVDVKLRLPIDVRRKFSAGGIIGSKNAVIVPEVKVAGVVLVKERRGDTRTGTKIDLDMNVDTAIDVDTRFSLGRWADKLTLRPEADIPTFFATNFFSVDTRSGIASQLPQFDPIFNASLGLSLDQAFDLGVKALTLGKGINSGTSFGFNTGVTLFDARIDRFGADLTLPTLPIGGLGLPSLPGFDAPALDAVTGLSDVLKRFRFGGADQLASVELLDPTENARTRSRYDTFDDGETVGYRTDTRILRAGFDLLGILGRAVGVPTGLHRTFARGAVTVDLAPAAVDVQAEIGFGREGTVAPTLQADLTNTSANALFYRDGAGVHVLAPGATLTGQRWDALPEFQASSPVDLAVDFTDLSLTQEVVDTAKVAPVVTLNMPKSVTVKLIGKSKPLLGSNGALISVRRAGDARDIVLGRQTSTVSGLGLGAGAGLTLNLAPEQPRFARSVVPVLSNLNPAAAPAPLFTTCDRVDISSGIFGPPVSLDVCDKNHDGSLNPNTEVVTAQQRDQFERQNARRARILDARAADRLRDEESGALVDITQFMAQDLALHVTGGENLTLRDVDFDHLFGQVHVEEGGSLQVSNVDGVPSDFVRPNRGVPFIRNDGSITITNGSNPDKDIFFSALQPVRTFTGTGETRFDLGGAGPQTGDKVFLSLADGGILLNDAQHTLQFAGGRNVRLSSPNTLGGAALVNLGTLGFEGTRFDVVLGGEAVSEADWAAGLPTNRHTTNSGTIRATQGAFGIFFNLNQLENSGLLAAEGGSFSLKGIAHETVTVGGINGGTFTTDNQLNLWNDGTAYGQIVADGSSFVDIDGRVRLRFGEHQFAARNGGRMDINDGIGRRFATETPDAGTADLAVGAGGVMTVGALARFDGSVRVEAGGSLALNGLASRTERGLTIDNAGLLDLLSGVHGPVPQGLFALPRSLGPGETAPPPSVGTVEPLDFSNTGTVRIHSPASLAFTADVTDFAFEGVAFDSGRFEVLGGKMAIGLRDITLDPQLFPAGGSTVLPDPATVKITHNRADVRLQGSDATLRYAFIDTLDDLPAVFDSGTDYLSYLTTNENRLTLDGYSATIQNDFDTSGLAPEFGPGELTLKNFAQLTVQGTYGNLAGHTIVESGAVLDASAGYRVEGGELTVRTDSNLGGLEELAGGGERIVAGRRFEISERTTTSVDAAGNPVTTTTAGVLDLQGGRRIVEIAGEVLLSGASARFDALDGFDRIAAGGRLSLDLGANLNAGTDATTRSGLENLGTLEIRNGAALSVFGDYREQAGSTTLVDSGGLLRADRWLIGGGQNVRIDGAAQGDVNASGAGTVIHGTGDIFGDLSLVNGAGVNPGNSPGTLDVFGDVSLDDGALLTSEIVGFGSGEFDRLNIFGDLVLGDTGAGARWTFDFTGFGADPVEHLNESLTVLVLDDLLDINGDPLLDAAGNPAGTGAIDGWFSVIDFIGLDGFDLAYLPGSALQNTMLLGRDGVTRLLLVRSDLGGQTRFDLLFAVPAPGTSGLLLLGLVALAARRRRGGVVPGGR